MPTQLKQSLRDFKNALGSFVSHESELARAELGPAAKSAGIGTGYVAGAIVFLLHAAWMFVLVTGLAVGLLINWLTPLGPWGSFTLGFVVSMLISLLIAGVLLVLARGKFSEVKKPEATIAEAKATLSALSQAIDGVGVAVETYIEEKKPAVLGSESKPGPAEPTSPLAPTDYRF